MDRFNSNDAKAVQEGASAHAGGLKLKDNPYQTGWESRSWAAGWADANRVPVTTGIYHGNIRTSGQMARIYLCCPGHSPACCILCDGHYFQRRRDGERFWLIANAEAGTPCYTCYPDALSERHHAGMAKVQEWLEQRLDATATFADGLPLGDIDDTDTDTIEVDYRGSS